VFRGELPRSAERQMVTLGTLTWLYASESGRRHFSSCTACFTNLPLSSSLTAFQGLVSGWLWKKMKCPTKI